jgi:hypothetical protein
MMLTIPFVIFGLFRYLQLVHRPAAEGGKPKTTRITDSPLDATDRTLGDHSDRDPCSRLKRSAPRAA